MFSPAVLEKAHRLLAERRVSVVNPDLGMYRVAGDRSTYLVTTDGKRVGYCTCPATIRGCAHLAAVLLVIRGGIPVPVEEDATPADPFEGVA